MPIGTALRVRARATAMPPTTNGAASRMMAFSQTRAKVPHSMEGSGDASSRAKQTAMERANAVDILERKALMFAGVTASSL